MEVSALNVGKKAAPRGVARFELPCCTAVPAVCRLRSSAKASSQNFRQVSQLQHQHDSSTMAARTLRIGTHAFNVSNTHDWG